MSKIKSNTTHAVLRNIYGSYFVSSQHKTIKAALKTCAALGKNCAEGHTIVVPSSEIERYMSAK